MPGELQEIAAEIREEAELHANTEYLARMREEWQQEDEAAPGVRDGAVP
jgi:hypothetical protein